MKSSAIAMAVGATAVSADMPVNFTSFTSAYSGDKCVFSKANGGVYSLPSDKCTQTEAMASILGSDSSPVAFTATSDYKVSKPTGASGNGPYTFGGSSFTPSGTYILTGNSWTTTFTGTGSDYGAWATSVASSDCETDTTVTSTVRGTVRVTVHRSSAPTSTGAWSSGASWDSSAAPASSAWPSGASWGSSAAPTSAWSSGASWDSSAAPTASSAWSSGAESSAAPATTGTWSSGASWDSSAAPTSTGAWSAGASSDSSAAPAVSSAWSSGASWESSAAPTGSAYSSGASWDSASSYGWATVTAGSKPSGAAGPYNGTWGSTTAAGATPNAPSGTGAANPTVVPINGGSSVKTATGMLAAVAMFAMVAL
ncbi:hypothetical protein PG993_000637 [Apiospora rasikravindrae]|uniref:Uncharacterized protein n=1 Tax=Apiospora rasikravindrae TaxID=990691 RepID=A0ABR1U951_9PEZI